ncbi:uncharacterized protein LOC118493911 [Sander lucioperca]|uniref:uncharacterized protein LOC118493911 n=1 Tax=Sander lucioperca TaxID=283035 RepID=UPI001653C0A5|nr:uncharacterized protein LOC118493911 [Sander lucioperca]
MEKTAQTPAPTPHPGAASPALHPGAASPPPPGVPELTEPASHPPSPTSCWQCLAAACVLAGSSHCGAAAVDRSGAVYQEQQGEVPAHQGAQRMVVPCPEPADLHPASRVPRPLLCMSAVPVDATQDLAAAALCTVIMTKAGLHRTIRRVLDIDGWYLMATEYLECRQCKKEGGHRASLGSCPPPTAANFQLYLRTSCPVTLGWLHN